MAFVIFRVLVILQNVIDVVQAAGVDVRRTVGSFLWYNAIL
jgi:hypothetical protein